MAQRALAAAPPEAAPEIEALLAEIQAASITP
jgi:hypothetical protein